MNQFMPDRNYKTADYDFVRELAEDRKIRLYIMDRIAKDRDLREKKLLLDVLEWTSKNEAWLCKCNLQVRCNADGLQPELAEFYWAENVSPQTEKAAKRSLRRLSSILAAFDEFKTNRMPQFCLAILGRLNTHGWTPDQAVVALAPLATMTKSGRKALPFKMHLDESERWLMQQKIDWQAKYLNKSTGSADNVHSRPRNRL